MGHGFRHTATALLALLAMAPWHSWAASSTIYADPDVRISFDGSDVMHLEAPTAASPVDPDLIFAAAQLAFPGRHLLDSETRIYVSKDAGARWEARTLPNGVGGSWDSSLSVGKNHTAYFVTAQYSHPGRVTVFRSNDDGMTWQAADAGVHSWDREFSAVDNTGGPRDGALYIVGSASDENKKPAIGVVSSVDGGKTFGKQTAVPGCGVAGLPQVLNDGALLVPCYAMGAPVPGSTLHAAPFGVFISKDGGQIFGPLIKIGEAWRIADRDVTQGYVKEDTMNDGYPLPFFAVAPKGAAFENRVYVVWRKELSRQHSELYLAHSTDGGQTWSMPIRIGALAATHPQDLVQKFPMIQVNAKGVVGVSWFDNRQALHKPAYDIYFTASTDGGESFLPEVRVSTGTSFNSRAVDGQPSIYDNPYQFPEGTYAFTSMYLMRSLAADYSEMSVDSAGRFHPVWPDARSGTFQLYTSAIRVSDPVSCSRQASADDFDYRKSLSYVFGTSEWDEAKGVVTIPVRFVNTSDKTLTSPIQVRVTQQGGIQDKRTKLLGSGAPLWNGIPIYSEGSSKVGPNATYTLPVSCEHPLFPNGTTAWQYWRLKAKRAYQMDFAIATAIGPASAKP